MKKLTSRRLARAPHPGNTRLAAACWIMIGMVPGAYAGSLTQNDADGTGLSSALMGALPTSPEYVAPVQLPPARVRKAVKKHPLVGPAQTRPGPAAIRPQTVPPHPVPPAPVAPALPPGSGVTQTRTTLWAPCRADRQRVFLPAAMPQQGSRALAAF